VRIATPGCLDQLVDNMAGCGLVRITHTEVDDVLARRARLLLELTYNIKNVRRQAFDTPKLIVHDIPTLQVAQAGTALQKREQTVLSQPRTVNAVRGTKALLALFPVQSRCGFS
jgi:hypothetical protein